jgi:putative membrane protein
MAVALLVAIVALLQAAFLVIEMFLWDTPTGHRIFRITPEFARQSKVLAANQGLYNGFLSAGLFWSLWLGRPGDAVTLFFLLCVLVAGLYGGLTASRNILFVQALPAAIAILGVLTL